MAFHITVVEKKKVPQQPWTQQIEGHTEGLHIWGLPYIFYIQAEFGMWPNKAIKSDIRIGQGHYLHVPLVFIEFDASLGHIQDVTAKQDFLLHSRTKRKTLGTSQPTSLASPCRWAPSSPSKSSVAKFVRTSTSTYQFVYLGRLPVPS